MIVDEAGTSLQQTIMSADSADLHTVPQCQAASVFEQQLLQEKELVFSTTADLVYVLKKQPDHGNIRSRDAARFAPTCPCGLQLICL